MKISMVALFKKYTPFFLAAAIPICTHAQKSSKDPVLKPAAILASMQQVADWQLHNWDTGGFKRRKYDWTYAAAYTGLAELSVISKDKKYEALLLKIGEDLDQPQRRR